MSSFDNWLLAQAEDHLREPGYAEWMEYIEEHFGAECEYDISVSLNKWGEPTAFIEFENGQHEEYDNLYDLQERMEHVDQYGYDK